jgi:hypothetical protein
MPVLVYAEEFGVVNQNYDYAFTPESETVKWVIFDDPDFYLMPGETKDIKYDIAVPLSAEPGGRYISLFATTDTLSHDGDTNAVKSRQRVASLLYINIQGDVSRLGNLMSLSSPWLIGEKSYWTATIQNTGTTHFHSAYSVVVNDAIFGNEMSKMSGDAMILPNSIRLVVEEFPMPRVPGIYKVTYTVGLGDMPSIINTRIMVYIPNWLYVVILLIAIYFVIRSVIKKRSKI